MNMRQTVEFDIALALQLRSQNVSLEAEAISGIDGVTWRVIKVVSGEHHFLYSNCSSLCSTNYSSILNATYNTHLQ